MRREQALFKILILLLSSLLLSSCGVKSTGRNRTLNNTDLASQSIAAECNTFSASGLQMLGRIKTYTDNTGTTAEDVHQLKFSDVPNSFLENSSQAIRFFRWKAVGTTTDLDPEPLDFRIEVDNGFGTYFPVTGYTDYFNKDDLIKINADYALGETDYISVLRRLRFAIFGTEFSYQALQVVLYNEGTNYSVGANLGLVSVFNKSQCLSSKEHYSPLYILIFFFISFLIIKNTWCQLISEY